MSNMRNQIKRGNIYFANLSSGVGSEQGGLRPVVIIQNNKGNKYSPTTIVAPITSRKNKTKLPTHIYIGKINNIQSEVSDNIILMEQIRVIDKSRLSNYIGEIPKDKLKSLDNAILISCGVNI